MAAYSRQPPLGPRRDAEAGEAYRRSNNPSRPYSYGPQGPGAFQQADAAPSYGPRPPGPPASPRDRNYRPGPPNEGAFKPLEYRNPPAARPSEASSPRNSNFSFPPRHARHDADTYRGAAFVERPDYDTREPPAKRFRPTSFEPPRLTADTYRPHENGNIERSSYHGHDRAHLPPPSPSHYDARRTAPPPHQHYQADRYSHLTSEHHMPDARPPYDAGDYPIRPKPFEQAAYGPPHPGPDIHRGRMPPGNYRWHHGPPPISPRAHAGPIFAQRGPPHGDEQPYMRHQISSATSAMPPRFEPPPFRQPEALNRAPLPDREERSPVARSSALYQEKSPPGVSKGSQPNAEVGLPAQPEPQQSPSPKPLTALERQQQPAAEDLSTSSSGVMSPRRSPSPPFIQQNFDLVLRAVAEDPRTRALLSQETLIDRSRKVTEGRQSACRDVTNLDTHQSDIWLHSRIRGELEKTFRKAAKEKEEHIARLCEEYRDRNDQWKKHCERLDKLQAAEAAALQAIQSRADHLHTPTLPPLSARSSSRRGTGFFGDAVRSEAEFQELLASLEAEEMTDPTLRATRTAAIVPDMLLPNDPERELAALDLDSTLVMDPVTFFQLEPGREVADWTQEEQSIFCKRFAQHPKIFGKIAASLPGRSTADCVRFYYHNKYRINFRSLLDKRAKRRNRGLRKGASSLLSNLQSTKRDEGEEEALVEADTSTPDLRYAATVPIRDRHHSMSAADGRPENSRSNSSKKAARFALPLASVAGQDTRNRSRTKSMPMLPSIVNDDLPADGLLPPLRLESKRNGGPSLGYFNHESSAATNLKQPSPRQTNSGVALDRLLLSNANMGHPEGNLDWDQDTDEDEATMQRR